MATFGEKLLADFSQAKAALIRLTHEEYEPTQIRDIISSVGAKTEIFLKSVVLPGRDPKNTFEWFIDELATVGITAALRDKLHALRRKYNIAKHDPRIVIDVLETLAVIQESTKTIEQIVIKDLGFVSAIINPHLKRVFWIAVWDHYAHGDSEVHIIFPAESQHWLGPPTFDIIYVDLSSWDGIKTNLALVGSLRSGEGIIPESQYTAFNDDSDFLGAWVFEGDYRSLITTLAQHELRQDLIPGLNRHDKELSMVLAYLLASIDVVVNGVKSRDLVTEIHQQAIAAYAVPADYRDSQNLASEMAEMFLQVNVSNWSQISGPSWIGDAKYNEIAPTVLAKHSSYHIVIDTAYVVRMLWSHE